MRELWADRRGTAVDLEPEDGCGAGRRTGLVVRDLHQGAPLGDRGQTRPRLV